MLPLVHRFLVGKFPNPFVRFTIKLDIVWVLLLLMRWSGRAIVWSGLT